MEVRKLIIHELKKEQRITEAHEFLSDNVYPINDDTFDLVDKLNRSFIRDSITYAVFNEEEGDNFPNYFNQYIEADTSDGDFIQFTRSIILNLKQIIRPVILARGGYFIISEYQDNDNLFLSVFLIRDEKGIIFRRRTDENGFEISAVAHLNTNKLAMGCRININRYNAKDGKYLALIKNNQADISDYFNLWISTMQPESSSEYTNTLYHLISNVAAPINPATETAYQLDEFRKKVYDYIKSSPNKIVNIVALSSHFYGDSEYLTLFAEHNDYQLDYEFKADGRRLKKFWNLDIKSDGIHLQFSRGDFNTKVKFSEDNPDMIIIESSIFANKLRIEASDELN